MSKKKAVRQVIGKGRFLQLVLDGRWEIAERVNASGAVAIIAVTKDKEYVLTDQFRPAVGRNVIDLPAGLCGDIIGQEDEAAELSAQRELEEETGFRAKTLRHLDDCPSSPGLTNEVISYFIARGVTRVAEGGGVEHENIVVQTPRLRTIKKWLKDQVAAGKMIDPKVYVGLYFIEAGSRR